MAGRDRPGSVDFTVLESMTGGDRAISDEVLELFVEQARRWSATADPASEGWRDATHAIRGAAAGIGARDLASTCAKAEVAAQDQADLALQRVREALEQALADIAVYRRRLL